MKNLPPRPQISLPAIASASAVLGILAAYFILGFGDTPFETRESDPIEDERIDGDRAGPRPTTPEGPEPTIESTQRPKTAPPEIVADEEEELEPCPNESRTHIRLFGDAQVRPTYQHRTMLGVRISGVTEGSFWDELGIDDDDLIVEANGQLIDSVQASVDLLNELERSEVVHIKVLTIEGRDRWLNWEAPSPPDPSTLPEHCR